MAGTPISANTIWEAEAGASDSNGGGFDPSQTSGMATDGAATAANTASPVFSSASYNFVSADIGAWLFLPGAGFFKIASVASNKATLSAAAGAGVTYTGAAVYPPCNPTTTTGISVSASPTSLQWTVDYSQQTTARYTYTDLAIQATATQIKSSANPLGVNCVGNVLNVTGGTGFTVQRATVNSITGGAGVTSASSWGTASSTSGTGYLGGALATPGQASASHLGSNKVYIQSGTYTLSNTTANTSGGQVSDNLFGSRPQPTWWEGYGSVRGDLGTPPVISAGSQTSVALFALTSSAMVAKNITCDGASSTSTTGITGNSVLQQFDRMTGRFCTTIGITASDATWARCTVHDCTSAATAGFNVNSYAKLTACESYGNAAPGFLIGSAAAPALVNCISSGNTGASSDGFQFTNATSYDALLTNCVSYGNGRHGFNCSATQCPVLLVNCLAEANSGYGYTSTGENTALFWLLNCGAYNNTSGDYNTTAIVRKPEGFVSAGGSFFVSASTGNFALNSLANQGNLARGAGYPGVMPRGTSTGYADMGAVPHADRLVGVGILSGGAL